MSLRYLVRRIAQAIVLVFLITVVVFLLVHLVPGDPARLILGDTARQVDVDALREQLGLDRPLREQYLDYARGLLQGDLGTSIRARKPVLELVLLALPKTLTLTFAALGLASVIGIPLGILAGMRRGSAFDRGAMVLALAGQSIPAFWLGLMLVAFVAARVEWLPTSGTGGWQYLVLPAIALAPSALGMILRVTRIAIAEAITEDYIQTAVAKGVRAPVVVTKHALKNALIPVITIMGLQMGALLGGAIVTETVFAWPGLGRLAVGALIDRDYPVVQGIVLVAAVTLVTINLVVDILYAAVDRRVEFR
jgi:peptide/nickel transport system permease protein